MYTLLIPYVPCPSANTTYCAATYPQPLHLVFTGNSCTRTQFRLSSTLRTTLWGPRTAYNARSHSKASIASPKIWGPYKRSYAILD